MSEIFFLDETAVPFIDETAGETPLLMGIGGEVVATSSAIPNVGGTMDMPDTPVEPTRNDPEL